MVVVPASCAPPSSSSVPPLDTTVPLAVPPDEMTSRPLARMSMLPLV
jgi:hypothetical protein